MGKAAQKVLERKQKDKQAGFIPKKREAPQSCPGIEGSPMDVILKPGVSPHLATFQGRQVLAVPEISPQGLLRIQACKAFKNLSCEDQKEVIRKYRRDLITLPLLD